MSIRLIHNLPAIILKIMRESFDNIALPEPICCHIWHQGCRRRVTMNETASANIGRAVLGVARGFVELFLHFANVDDLAHQSFHASARRNSPSRLSQTYHSPTIGL